MSIVRLIPESNPQAPTEAVVFEGTQWLQGQQGPSGAEPPREWLPGPRETTAASYPSPLGRAMATRRLLEAGQTDHPLAQASARLMCCLAGGSLGFEWVPLADLSESLQRALRPELGGRARIGLIRSYEDEAVWGFMLEDGIPTIAGARAGNEDDLMRMANASDKPRVKRLLELSRVHADDWAPEQHTWMRVFDLAAELCGDVAAADVDATEDVRSLGPFRWDRGGEGDPLPHYLLSFSAGFVTRTARALLQPARELRTPSAQQIVVGQGAAEVRLVKPNSPANQWLDFGFGCARGVAPADIDGDPTRLSEADLMQLPKVSDHVSALAALRGTPAGVPELHELLSEQPVGLSDLGRVVARFGRGRAQRVFSARFEEVCRADQLPITLVPDDLNARVGAGTAFVLDGDGVPAAAYVEDGPSGRQAGAREPEVGDLSLLGTACWFAFTRRAQRAGGTRALIIGREQLFPQSEGFPLSYWGGQTERAHPARQFWQGEEYLQAAGHCATIQRFHWAFQILGETEASDLQRLIGCASMRFIDRLVGVEKARQLRASEAGRPERVIDTVPLEVPGYGRADIPLDPLRGG